MNLASTNSASASADSPSSNAPLGAFKLKAWLMRFFVMLVVALGIEVLVFNQYYWSFDADTFKYQELTLPYNEQLQRNAILVTNQNPVITFANIKRMIASVDFEVYGGSNLVKGRVRATSETQQYSPFVISKFESASFFDQDPNQLPKNYQQLKIKFDLLEPVYNLYLQFDSSCLNSPVLVTKVKLNVPPTFNFSVVRVLLMLLGFSLLYVVVLSTLYQHTLQVDSRLYKRINRGIFGLAILCALGVFAAYHPKFTTDSGFKQISLGFIPYNTPNHSLLQEIPTTQEGLGNVDEYIELTDALLVKHQLNVDLWVDPELFKLNNMHDASERSYKNVKFYLDRAFNNGKYYVYFGLAPFVLIYAPIYLVTGLVPGAVFAVFIAAVYALIGLHLLSSRLTNLLCDECNTTLFVVTKFTMYMCSFIFLLQGQITFYVLPYLTGITAVCIAMYCALGLLLRIKRQVFTGLSEECAQRANADSPSNSSSNGMLGVGRMIGRISHAWRNFWQEKTPENMPFSWDFKTMGGMVVCGLCVVLAVMSRPAILLYLVCGVGICYVLYVCKVQQTIKAKLINSLCLFIPVILGAIVVCSYNYARFGSIFEFGQYLQLTGDDVRANYFRFNLAYIKTAIFNIFFIPFELSSSFPFVMVNQSPETQAGQYVYITQRFGLFMLPYFWGLFLLPVLLKLKHLSSWGQQYVLPPLQSSLALGGMKLIVTLWYVSVFVVLFLTIYMAGWAIRYAVDITCVLAVLPFVFTMLLKFNWQSQVERIFYLGWLLACVISCISMFLVCINNDSTALNIVNPDLYVDLKNIFDPLRFD